MKRIIYGAILLAGLTAFMWWMFGRYGIGLAISASPSQSGSQNQIMDDRVRPESTPEGMTRRLPANHPEKSGRGKPDAGGASILSARMSDLAEFMKSDEKKRCRISSGRGPDPDTVYYIGANHQFGDARVLFAPRLADYAPPPSTPLPGLGRDAARLAGRRSRFPGAVGHD